MDDGLNYRTDVPYVPHYTPKLSPAAIRFALLLRGHALPEPEPGEPFRYLELGFGRGCSLALHAATNEGEFWGVDFLPDHCEAARKTVAAAGLDCRILEDSFAGTAAAAAGGKLPRFDIVALHGVWSWVDDRNRDHILDILRHCLKPGGCAYVSYNALPGWSVLAPVRDLMLGMLETEGGGNPEARIRAVMDRLAEMARGDGIYFRLNPLCGIYLEEMAAKPAAFLAHDFFNPTWQPFSFRDVAGRLAEAGCSFAASMDLFSHSSLCLPPEARGHVSTTTDPHVRETLRDFAVNTQFRADLFLREPRRLGDGEHRDRLGKTRLRLGRPREEIGGEIDWGGGKIDLGQERFVRLLDALPADGRETRPLADCAEPLLATGERRAELCETLAILREAGMVLPVVAEPPARLREASCLLNRELCRQFFAGEGTAGHLASPLYGGGYPVSDEEQVMLHFRPASSNAEEWAEGIVRQMISRGLDRPYSEALAREVAHVEEFTRTRIPLLENHGVLC